MFHSVICLKRATQDETVYAICSLNVKLLSKNTPVEQKNEQLKRKQTFEGFLQQNPDGPTGYLIQVR